MSLHSVTRPFSFLYRKPAPLSTKVAGGIALSVSILAASTFNGFAKELGNTYSPFSLIFISELLTLTFVFMTYGFFPTFESIWNLKLKQIRNFILIGILTGIAGPLLWFTGLEYTTAINAGFFSKSEMIFLIVLAHFYLNEPLKREHFSSAATILIGLLIIALEGFSEGLRVQIGDFIIMCGIFCYAVAHVFFRKNSTKLPHQLPLVARSGSAVAFFFLSSPFREERFIDEFMMMDSSIIPALLGFAFISRFLNSITFYEALDRLEVSTISLVSSLTVVGSTIFASVYLHEAIEWYHIVGGTFIILGTLLLELLGHKKPDEHVEQQMVQRITH